MPQKRKLSSTTSNDRAARPGGRPLDGDTPMVLIAMRVTQEQRDKLKMLGGAAWVRDRIDRESISESRVRVRLRTGSAEGAGS